MRVHVTIPGTVDSYCIDERGDKRVATDELWLETYLCSVLRAYSYADDGSGDTIRKVVGFRRFNPVTSTETEHRFLQAAEQLFFRGKRGLLVFEGFSNSHRVAIGFRFGGSSTQQRLEPSYIWPPQILPNHRAIRIWHQPFRETTHKKC